MAYNFYWKSGRVSGRLNSGTYHHVKVVVRLHDIIPDYWSFWWSVLLFVVQHPFCKILVLRYVNNVTIVATNERVESYKVDWVVTHLNPKTKTPSCLSDLPPLQIIDEKISICFLFAHHFMLCFLKIWEKVIRHTTMFGLMRLGIILFNTSQI